MKFQALSVMLIGVVCLSLTAVAATPSGITLLQQMRKAAQTVSYSARETTWRQNTPALITQVWDNGLKQRMEYIAPVINKGDIQVDDGVHIWRYHHSENGVVQSPSNSSHRFDAGKFSQKYSVKVLGSANISGRAAWIIGITARNNSRYLRKYWIDKSNYLRLRAEYFDSGEKRTEATQLSALHFSPVSSSRFVWKTPAGASVNYAGELYSHLNRAQQEASWIRVPRWLPHHYIFENAVVNKADNEVWLRYTNGSNRFSIFEQRTNDTKSSPLQQVDGGWFWKKGGMRFLIAGLSAAQTKNLASSF